MSGSVSGPGLRPLFDRFCDLAPDRRGETLRGLGADAAMIAELEALLNADRIPAERISRPIDAVLASLPETELDDGDRLGAWRLSRRLGKGGMGAVYLAERADGHFRQQAAVKLIRSLAGDDTALHFARERQILATLRHPHIARLLDGGATPAGQPYLVMEYVEGVPIDEYCALRGLDLDARLRLFGEVCAAVQFAHQQLIVHCDLKPSNVLVRDDGTPVLLDFGIARALDRAGAAEPAETAWFTPDYASPEQLRGDPVGAASDVYALGLILFELVSGRKARIDADDRTIARLGHADVRPSELAAGMRWRRRMRGDIDAIVLKATADAPLARYPSAQGLADDLLRFRQSRPVLARSQGVAYRTGRLLRRRWPVFAIAAAAVALIGAFTWRLAAERDRARAAEHDARVQATTAERVSGFLVSVFDVSNPKRNQRRDLSAREVLDHGAVRIEAELADQPAVKARLLDTLATAYRYIGAPRRSVELFRHAAELYLDPRVDKPLAAAAALSQLAVLYSNENYPLADAEAAARRSLELRERHASPDSLELADAHNSLGVVLEGAGRLDEAETELRRALAIRRARAGGESEQVAAVLHNLALVERRRGAYPNAIADLEHALAIKQRVIGARDPGFQRSLENLAMSFNAIGAGEGAIVLFERNLALCKDIYGGAGTSTAHAQNELGSVLHDRGRFGDATRHYREAMRLYADATGADSADYAVPLNNLASAYEDMGDYAAAIPLFRQSLDIRRKALPDDDARVVHARYNLARVLIEAGALEEAKPVLDTVLARFRARGGATDGWRAKAELWNGEWQLRSGAVAAAAGSLQQLLASNAAFTPLMRARCATLAAGIAAARGDRTSALASHREAWQTLSKALGATHPLTAESAIAYAAALDDSGRAQEARALAVPLLPIVDAAFAADAPARRLGARWASTPARHRPPPQ